MGYQTQLAVALRDWGLNVVEVNGWQTRGSSTFNPGGSVNHHTAGSRSGTLPSLNILTNGRSDLPGPLCNVAQSRSSEFNAAAKYDDVYVIAAGRANHAGRGGYAGLTGNSSVFGLEVEHTGNLSTEPWPERRQHTAFRVHGAFTELGKFDTAKVCQHKEWTTRKIDFIDANGQNFRDAVALTAIYRAQHENEDTDMKWTENAARAFVVNAYRQISGREVESEKSRENWVRAMLADSTNTVHLMSALTQEARVRGENRDKAFNERIAKLEGRETPASEKPLSEEQIRQILVEAAKALQNG